MESVFSAVIVLFALLFYFSNRGSVINRWCAFYLAIASIGVIKEAFLYQAVPWITSVWGNTIDENLYFGVYSVMTWISYSFANPVIFIVSLYFLGLDGTNPRLLSIIKATICIPAIVLSFIYFPVRFRSYQLEDRMFWVVYCIYNLGLGIAVIFLMLKGIIIEKSASLKRQKTMLAAVILPASIYVLVTIFVIHPLGLERWFKAWQWNVVIVFISLLAFIFLAFKSGFMGLKLSAQIYDWPSEMDLVGKAADYTSHMLKNQTSKMELCIEQLKLQLASGENMEIPEEIAILSRSVSALKEYTDRMKRHSQAIRLLEEPCNLSEMILEATSASMPGRGVDLRVNINDDVYWVCDKRHMTEVFANIFKNALEAIHENGAVEISGSFDKHVFLLRITDNGVGMSGDELKSMFAPYFTTKSTGKNFGLGLAYCKNVITKHGGSISAKSNPGKGTAVTIAFPVKRVAESFR